MKKFAAIILSMLMVLSMVAIAVTSVSAEAIGNDGKLTIHKKDDADPSTSTPGRDKKGLNDAQFTIYKIFEHTADGYVLQEKYTTALADYVTNLTNANNTTDTYVTYGSTDALEAYIGKLIAASKSDSGRMETTGHIGPEAPGGEDGVAVFDNLDYGVYLVVETKAPEGYTAKSQAFLVHINYDAENGIDEKEKDAYPKNELFKFEKDINDNGTPKQGKSYSIGDIVEYIVKAKTPNYNTQTLDALQDEEEANKEAALADTSKEDKNDYAKPYSTIPFYFKDTLSKGLTLKLGSGTETAEQLRNAFTVKIDGTPINNSDEDDLLFTVTETSNPDGSKTYTINFYFTKLYDKDAHINYLGKDIEITYKATLNSDAVVNGDSTTDTNKNDIDLYFKNDPTTGGDPPKHDTTGGDPEVYTYEFKLTKLLNGKNFSEVTGDIDYSSLRFVLTTDDYGITASGSAGVYTVTSDSEEDKDSATQLEVKSDGTLIVRGLSAGTYYLTEEGSVSSTAGSSTTKYTPLSSSIKIVVEEVVENSKVTGKVKATIKNGNTDINLAEIDNPAYDATKAGAELGQPGYDPNYDKSTPAKISTGKFALSVNNPASQFDLPTTGGYGILIFTLGAAVVLAGAIVLFTLARKKKSSK